MNKDSFKKWEGYFKKTVKHSYPKWPNEAMVKIIFGNYLKNKINISSKFRVLDVGCGFGNNLLPFLDIGCQCFGTEVTEMVARQTQRILQVRGFDVDIRCGKNTGLPFEDNLFDLVLSINVIHYERTESDIRSALSEYKRVLRRGGRLVLSTVAPKHEIFQRAHPLGFHQYEIRNFDFRNGEIFFFFENLEYLRACLDDFFDEIEVGRVTEQLMSLNLDFFIGAGVA